MAEFSLKAAGIRCDITYDATPSTPAVNALDVQKSTFSGEFVIDDTIPTTPAGYVRSSTVGLPYLDLTSGTKWWIEFNAQIGSSDNTAVVDCYLVDSLSNNREYGKGTAESTGHVTGIPPYMNGTHCAGGFIWTSNGTRLEFAFKSILGPTITVYVGDVSLIAIPLDDFTENTDYFYIAGGGSLDYDADAKAFFSTQTGAYEDVLSSTIAIIAPGEYMIRGSMGIGTALDTTARARITENGTPITDEWIKRAEDSRDRHNANFLSVHSYQAGNVTLAWQGYQQTAGALSSFYQPRIIVFRLAAFEKYAHDTQIGTLSATTTYPGWNELHQTGFTGYQDEYVLALGQMMCYRAAEGSVMGRLVNATTGSPLYEVCSISNTVSINSDRPSLWIAAATLTPPTTNTYRLDFTGEEFGGDSANAYNSTIVLIGLTPKVSSGTNYQVTISDTTHPPDTFGDDGGATMEGGTVVQQPPPVLSDHGGPIGTGLGNETITTVKTSQAVVPTDHPVMWFNDSERFSRVLQLANYDENGNSLGAPDGRWSDFISSNGQTELHSKLLKYLVTKNSSDLSLFQSRLNTLANTSMALLLDKTGGQEPALQLASDRIREFAYSYDWGMWFGVLSATEQAQLEDLLKAMTFCLMNPGHSTTVNIVGNSVSGWGLGNPYNNYFYRKHVGALLCIMALYNDWPSDTSQAATFHWPPGSSTQYSFTLPYNAVNYTDPKLWFSDRMQDYLDPAFIVDGEGGGWTEGSNYSHTTKRAINEMYSIGHLAFPDVFNSDIEDRCRDSILFEMYCQYPGNTNLVHWGDDPGSSPHMGVSDPGRITVHMMVDAFRNTTIGSYGQYWLENYSSRPTIGPDGVGEMRIWELILYDANRTAYNFTESGANPLPTHYHAGAGFLFSRSSWNSTAFATNFIAHNWSNRDADHTHEDKLGIFIHAGGGGYTSTLLTDPHNWQEGNSTLYLTALAKYHNVYDMGRGVSTNYGGTGQTHRNLLSGGDLPDPLAEMALVSLNPTFVYAQGDGSDAYYTRSSNNIEHVNSPREKINDIFMREFVHLKDLNIVMAYDRVKMTTQFASGPADCMWQWNLVKPTAVNPTTLYVDQSGWRLFHTYFISQPAIQFGQWSLQYGNPWYERARLSLSNRFGKLLTVFEGFNGTPVSGTPMVEISNVSDTMEGVSVQAATYRHVVFSAEEDGATPTSPSYRVTKNDGTDIHIVANLTPGTLYVVTETVVSGSVYRYTIAEQSSGLTGILADSGGVITFTPNDLSSQGGYSVTISDSTLTTGLGASTVSTMAAFGTTVSDNVPKMGEEGVSAPINTTHYDAYIPDSTPTTGLGESTVETQSDMAVTISDGGSGKSSVTTVTDTSILWGGWTEKRIRALYPTQLYPNEEIGGNFVTPEPFDQSLADVLRDADDGSFVRFASTPPQTFFSELTVGLDDAAGYVGTIRTLQFNLTIRSCNPSLASNPTLLAQVYYKALVLAEYSFPLPFVSESSPQLFASPIYIVELPKNVQPDLTLKLKPVIHLSQSMSLEIARAWLEVSGDLKEKVI